MSRRRTERLVNLVICLLATRRFLTAAQIARTVAGYEHDPDDPKAHEAFQRMFERDKSELRELGVPLETGTSSVFDTEPGYRIARRDYALPDVRLEPDEAAAVGLAARLWQHAGLASSAASGLRKLRAGGVEVDTRSALEIEPVVTAEPVLDSLLSAIHQRSAVSFAYRSMRDDAPTTRHLQPWGAVSWRGRWYVVGYDADRSASRCFRLSRIVGPATLEGEPGAFTPPENVDLQHEVAKFAEHPNRRGKAEIRMRSGVAAGLRRAAIEVQPDPSAPGWDTATVEYSDPEALAARLAGYGSAVVVLGPPEVRTAVIDQLTAMAGERQ